jgi:hypothetical protein
MGLAKNPAKAIHGFGVRRAKASLSLLTGSPTLLPSLNLNIGKPNTKEVRTPKSGAGNEARTRDPNLGKVVLYH